MDALKKKKTNPPQYVKLFDKETGEITFTEDPAEAFSYNGEWQAKMEIEQINFNFIELRGKIEYVYL